MSGLRIFQASLFSTLLCVVILFFGVQAGPPLQLDPLSGLDEFNVNEGFNNHLLNSVRLPRDLNPLHYDLEIRPILTQGSTDRFDAPGTVVIRIRCVVPTPNITLHAFDMMIGPMVTVTSINPIVEIPVRTFSMDSSLQTLTIELNQTTLVAGMEYDVRIPFIAKVGDRMDGLYRSFYVDDDGNQIYHATTQFQKLGARKAFPCFDEPNFRSKFNITIGRLTEYNTLCNSPLEDTKPIPGMDGWVWDVYGTTVDMPSYLIAIIVSDFVSVEAPSDLSNYVVKTWGPPGMTNNASAEFSAQAAAKILDFFETYFDSPYQFPKLDSVAVPIFEAGAMENWALNTYRLALMLWYEGESTQFEQWRQSAVIAHEITHHWFGDLVTCDWWNDIWLNEGFARYMQFIGASQALTQHGIMDRYTIDVTILAMDFDAGSTTEPVRNGVTDQVTNQNSRIIYEKAAALIRMMQFFLTEDTLIKGLRVYLDKYQYSNTVQDQLFAELQTQADTDGTAPIEASVKQIMDSWTLKSGFPIVTLRRAGGNAVFISQEAFVPLDQKLTKQDPAELWYVPIAFASKSNPDFTSVRPKLWLDKWTLATTKIVEESTDEWIILNPDARSFFRTVYDSHFFSLILSQLNEDHTVISLSSRSQLIDDYFKSAFAGYVSIESAFNLTQYLDKEDENTVWTTVFNNLRQINRYFQDNLSVHDKFKNYLLGKITPVLNRIGWQQDSNDLPVTVILRTQLLDWACSFGAANCTEITTKYIEELDQGTRIPADIQPMVFCKAVSMADSLNFDIKDHVFQGYKNATRVERHTVFINAIACNNPIEAEIIGLLDSAIADPSDFTTTHAIQLMQRLADNPENRATMDFFLRMNIRQIITVLGESAISGVVTTMASYTSTIDSANGIRGVINSSLNIVTDESVIRSLHAANETLDKNINWMTTYASRIETWLDSA